VDKPNSDKHDLQGALVQPVANTSAASGERLRSNRNIDIMVIRNRNIGIMVIKNRD